MDADAVHRWRAGANEAYKAAGALHGDGLHSLSLYFCHLAIERAIKASYIDVTGAEPPHSDNVVAIALLLDPDWSKDELSALDALAKHAAGALRDWGSNSPDFATAERSEQWVLKTAVFLSAYGA